MGTFSSSLKGCVKNTLSRVNSQCYAIARDLFLKVVEFTPSPEHPGPYAKGHLANQWYPSDDGDFSEELSSATSRTGSDSISRITGMQGFACFGRDGKLTLTNNLSYAYRAEAAGWPASGGWSGNSTPYRMVARAIQIIKAKY